MLVCKCNGLVLIGVALAAAQGAPDADRTYVPAKVQQAPTIDGSLADACWTSARKVLFRNGNVPTTAALCYDERALYVAVDCPEPKMSQVKDQFVRRDDPVWGDDCVEVFVAPDYANPRFYYHFAVNPRGTMTDAQVDLRLNYGWNGSWTAKARRRADRWTVEMRIPFADLGIKAPADVPLIGVAVCRERRAATKESGTEWSMWQIGGGFHAPAGHVLLGTYPAYVQRCIVNPWNSRRDSALKLAAAVAGPDGAALRALVETRDRDVAACPPQPTADDVNTLLARHQQALDALRAAERQAQFAVALARLHAQVGP
jgi:hypothetical protein